MADPPLHTSFQASEASKLPAPSLCTLSQKLSSLLNNLQTSPQNDDPAQRQNTDASSRDLSSPLLKTHVPPLPHFLDEIQEILRSFSAKNDDGGVSHTVSDLLLISDPSAEQPHIPSATFSKDAMGNRQSPVAVPPTSSQADHTNPIMGSASLATELPRKPPLSVAPFDLDPHTSASDPLQLSNLDGSFSSPQISVPADGKNCQTQGTNQGETKKSFLSALCGAPDVLSTENIDLKTG